MRVTYLLLLILWMIGCTDTYEEQQLDMNNPRVYEYELSNTERLVIQGSNLPLSTANKIFERANRIFEKNEEEILIAKDTELKAWSDVDFIPISKGSSSYFWKNVESVDVTVQYYTIYFTVEESEYSHNLWILYENYLIKNRQVEPFLKPRFQEMAGAEYTMHCVQADLYGLSNDLARKRTLFKSEEVSFGKDHNCGIGGVDYEWIIKD